MKLVFSLTLVFLAALAQAQDGPPPIVGRWKEDSSLRTGLNDFLWARDVGWFKRQAAKLISWQSEQTIFLRGNRYSINGVKGPRSEVFAFDLVTDNRTTTNVDLGALGGPRLATAEIKGNTVITYLHKPEDNVIDMIATRTILENPDVMIYKTKDLPYGYEMVSVMNRQT